MGIKKAAVGGVGKANKEQSKLGLTKNGKVRIRAAGGGNKLKYGVPLKRVTMSIRQADVDYLRELGKGVVSNGVVKLIDERQARMNEGKGNEVMLISELSSDIVSRLEIKGGELDGKVSG